MRTRLLVLALAAGLVAPSIARGAGVIPEYVPDVPVLGQQADNGGGLIRSFAGNIGPTDKHVDGNIADWTGAISRFGGTSIYSHGEFVYQDFLGDNWGADDGADEQRAQTTDTLNQTEPRTYRLEALAQVEGEQDPVGAGCPSQVPEEFCGYGNYGNVTDTNIRRETDIEEVRVAADDQNVYVLVRTAEMTTADKTGVALIFGDGSPPGAGNPGPAGLTTASKTWLLASGNAIDQASNITGAQVATNPDGYTNAVEISVPRAQVVSDGTIKLAAGTCYMDGDACKSVKTGDAKSDLLNVAFRTDEPARIWMDHSQAFALHDGNIDKYMATIYVDKLTSGFTENFTPRPGYYERTYVSHSPVNDEAQYSGAYFQGEFQNYGLYLPRSFREDSGSLYPATWWAHYRGGHTHDAAAWVPGLIRDFGEGQGNIMIFPSARGTSSWYVGRGMEDFLEVWDDSMHSFPIDPDRVHMTGYSMGGWASWLLPLLMPDRFAAASPEEGPATQGLFVAPGITTQPQNGAYDTDAENTYNILGNARNVAYAIYNGNTDELVWISGIAAMHAKLTQLGYNNRLYQIDGGEHYASAVLDQWTEAAKYVNGFTRDPNPPHITYTTWPALEHAVSTISTLPGQDLRYRFNSAYWVSDLEARTVRVDPTTGRPNDADMGTIDAQTWGRGMTDYEGFPEAGAGVQGSGYQMTGWRDVVHGHEPARNDFLATLTNLKAATLDVARMGLSTQDPIDGDIVTDGPTSVRLTGSWGVRPDVLVCPDSGVTVDYDAHGLTIDIPRAASPSIDIIPAGQPVTITLPDCSVR